MPSDLSPEEFGVLRLIAEAMDEADEPRLRARVYDVSWTFGDRGDSEMMKRAIDAYAEVPLEAESWYADGQDECRRALELVVRRGADGSTQREGIAQVMIDRLRAAAIDDRFFPVQLSSTIRAYRLAGKDDASGLAEVARGMAERAREVKDLDLEQAWEEEAGEWYRLAGLHDQSAAARVRVARSLAREAAERRLAGGGAAIAAGHFVEQALKVMLLLPRSYRAAHGIDGEIDKLRRELRDDRSLILESMVPIRTGPVDTTGLVAYARSRVSGLEPLAALIGLADLHPGASLDTSRAQAESLAAKNPLSHLFSSETFNADGQKVASRPGISLNATQAGASEPVDPAIWHSMVRDHRFQVSLVVDAMIRPAIEIVTLQHRFTLQWLFDMCRASPWIPAGHELSWAKGLLHGLNRDFPSAAVMLVPQLEHFVRHQLRGAGVHTKITDDLGVETEKGLTALLDEEETERVFGADLRFEFRALFTDQAGANLRNTIAHGLASDADLLGAGAAYAWWIALRFAVVPFREEAGEAASPSVDDEV